MLADHLDDDVMFRGIMLSSTVRRFLARRQTQRIIDAGLLDEDMVKDLQWASDKMWDARLARLTGQDGS